MKAKPIPHEEAELLFNMGAMLYVSRTDFHRGLWECTSCWESHPRHNLKIGEVEYYPVGPLRPSDCGGPHFPSAIPQYFLISDE